jgi:quinoprotein glucose dehydrogenase
MSEDQVLNRIKEGAGKMPPFAAILKGHEEGIINYLFEKTDNRLLKKERDLSEMKDNNISRNKEKQDTAARYLNVTAYYQIKDPDGHPAVKPPWGKLNAINLNTGEYEWTIPVGNIPELQKKGEPITGSESSPGPIVTAGGLVFLGGTRDRKFQAFDKATGKLLWETTLPGFASSSPSTYKINGKQYVVLSVAGNKESPAGGIMAFTLPD